jgi:glycosyltransferase involved in cell wall biosynthesis
MKVLHFYKTYYPDTIGGVEQVINQLARSVLRFGIQTDVLSLSVKPKPSSLELDGHWVHRVKTSCEFASTPFSWSAFSRFAELSKQADIIHYHYPWPFMDMVHFITQTKLPTVLTYHSDIIRQKRLLNVYRPLNQRFLAQMKSIVATSPNYLASSPILQCYRDKTEVIPIGLDKATYPAASPAILAKWRAKIGERFFLFIGMLRYYKGLHVLIEALRGTDFPVVIVGEGPTEKALKEQAAAVGLKNIHFTGLLPQEDKVALLSLCYGLVFPSHLRSEAFGISLLEGAMYGKPLISSEIGTGTSFVNIDQKTGFVVKPDAPAEFRKAMQALWDNPSLARAMGQQAEQRYWDYFTAEKMGNAYADLYQRVLR